MKLYPSLLLLLALCFGLQKSAAQTLRFKTSSVSYAEKSERGGWRNWSEFVKADIIIDIDAKKNRIVVNSPELQVFTILAYGDKTEDENTKVVPFDCIDHNGSKCRIFVITKKKEDNRMQFYINYSEVKFVYNIYNPK